MADERVNLNRQIGSIEQVAAMSDEDLRSMEAKHEAEIIRLLGCLEADPLAVWANGARQALRFLRLHKTWITAEITRRKRAAEAAAKRAVLAEQKQAREDAKAAKVQVQVEMTQRAREVEAARLERIKASNNENARHIAVFKEVAREVLGAEMYEHLWELTRRRLETAA